jgi:hypothetical protein
MKPFASLASAAQLAAKQWVETNPSNFRISLRTSVTSPHGTMLTAYSDVKNRCLRVLDRLVSTLPLPNLSATISHSFHIILIFFKSGFKFFNQEAHVLGKEDEHRLVRDRRLVLLVSILYFFSLSPTKRPNKLECFSLASFFSSLVSDQSSVTCILGVGGNQPI